MRLKSVSEFLATFTQSCLEQTAAAKPLKGLHSGHSGEMEN